MRCEVRNSNGANVFFLQRVVTEAKVLVKRTPFCHLWNSAQRGAGRVDKGGVAYQMLRGSPALHY